MSTWVLRGKEGYETGQVREVEESAMGEFPKASPARSKVEQSDFKTLGGGEFSKRHLRGKSRLPSFYGGAHYEGYF
jgi:hypothetical protein